MLILTDHDSVMDIVKHFPIKSTYYNALRSQKTAVYQLQKGA